MLVRQPNRLLNLQRQHMPHRWILAVQAWEQEAHIIVADDLCGVKGDVEAGAHIENVDAVDGLIGNQPRLGVGNRIDERHPPKQ